MARPARASFHRSAFRGELKRPDSTPRKNCPARGAESTGRRGPRIPRGARGQTRSPPGAPQAAGRPEDGPR
eukprot:508280-Pyramimonas_sp.AAC.1